MGNGLHCRWGKFEVGRAALIALIFLLSIKAYGASCCGGGSGAQFLITGDQRAQISLSQSQNNVIGDTNPSGESVFRNENNIERINRTNISGTYLFGEYIQVGVAANFQEKYRQTISGNNETNRGLGDLTLFSAYEFLPDLTYSVYRPRGFLTMELNVPTSPSVHDSESLMATDTRGSGFYSVSLGAHWLKVLGEHTLVSFQKIKVSKQEQFGAQTIDPGPEYSLGVSYSQMLTKSFSWNFGVTYQYKTGKKVIGSNLRESEYFFDTDLGVSYQISDDWGANLSYLDQTFIGPAKNTTLSRQISLNVTRYFSL